MKKYRFSKYVRPKIIVFLIIILALFASLFILNTPHNLFSSAKELARKCGYEGLTCCSSLNNEGTDTTYTCPNSPDSTLCYNANTYNVEKGNYLCKALKDVCGTGIGFPCCDDGTCGSNTNLKCLKYSTPDEVANHKYWLVNPWAIYIIGGFYNQDRGTLKNQSLGICGENNILPTPKSKLDTCGETDQNCCPGNFCEVKTSSNACFKGNFGLSSSVPPLCKPITSDNINYTVEVLDDPNGKLLTTGRNIAVIKREDDIYYLRIYVYSNILLQHSQNLTQYDNNLVRNTLNTAYRIYCNDNAPSIYSRSDPKLGDDGADIYCGYRADELTKAVHLSIIPEIQYHSPRGGVEFVSPPKIERTFNIYEAASVNPNPTSIESLSPSPSPSPTQQPPSSGTNCTKGQVLCGNKDQFACVGEKGNCCDTGLSLGADNKCK